MSPRTPYQKGRDLEYKARAVMESWFGCYCVRSAGSHSPADLICGNGIHVYLVQVKTESTQGTINWNTLREWSEMFQAIPMLLVYCRGGRWKIYVDGEQIHKEEMTYGEI